MNTDSISKQDKQAVVNLIDNINAISFYEANEHSKECYYDIRNAILAMPEQKPCKDTISRAEVHDLLATWLSDKLDEKTREVLEVIDGKVEDMPPVTTKQRTGHWISWTGEPVEIKNGSPVKSSWCSECEEWLVASDEYDCNGNFCPNCGAKMESEEQA